MPLVRKGRARVVILSDARVVIVVVVVVVVVFVNGEVEVEVVKAKSDPVSELDLKMVENSTLG